MQNRVVGDLVNARRCMEKLGPWNKQESLGGT